MMHVVRGRWRDWLRRAGWVLIGLAVLAVCVWILVRAFVARTPGEFQRWTNWSNILALVVGGVGVALVIFDKAGRRARPAVASAAQIESATADLTARIERDWAEEAALREVTRPAPILVRWSSTGRPAASRPVVLDDPLGGDWELFPLRGRTDALNQEIVAAFRGLPHRQLMILGEAGAGKSVFAVLLTLGLIRRPVKSEPLPVLLAINAWNPAERVDDFVARRLAEDYADVLARYGDPSALARNLVEHRRILPILDGLDELDAPTLAMEALDTFAAAGHPLVVTCRTSEYERAVRRGRVLSQAAVVELEPVGVEAAIGYLSQPRPDPRWVPVFAHLRAHPGGSLAQALSTPLMVTMARTVYHDPQTDPAELTTLEVRQAVTDRLMDAFVSSLYTNPPRRLDGRSGLRRTYPPRSVTRWLSCLAYHLYQSGTRDLHWWRIQPDLLSTRPGTSRIMTVACAMVLVALPAALSGAAVGNGWTAVRAAAAAAIVVGAAAIGWLRWLWPNGYPPYVPLRFRSPRRRRAEYLGLRFGYGLGCGALTGLITADLATALPAGLTCGLLAALLPAWHPRRTLRATATLSLRLNRRNAGTAAVQSAVISGAVFAVTAWLTDSTILTSGIAAASYATTAALGSGGWTWLRFRLTHVRLAMQGWLPWHLSAFLDDAHQRGVLRQAGTLYQFRHATLEDHLRHQVDGPPILPGGAYWDFNGASAKAAEVLVRQGRVDEAIDKLRDMADRVYPRIPTGRLTALLVQQGRVDEAIAFLRMQAGLDAKDRHDRPRPGLQDGCPGLDDDEDIPVRPGSTDSKGVIGLHR